MPSWIKNASTELIKIFLTAAIAGDGWTQNDHRTYCTISRKLADDMQELFLKIGRYSMLKERHPKDLNRNASTIRGQKVYSKNIQYHISEIRTKRAYLYCKNHASGISEKEYNGQVYCATVPNGTLICRRNGKTFMAGNCTVYAYAAALRAGMAHFNWQKIRAVRIDQSPGGSAQRKKRAKKQQPQKSRW